MAKSGTTPKKTVKDQRVKLSDIEDFRIFKTKAEGPFVKAGQKRYDANGKLSTTANDLDIAAIEISRNQQNIYKVKTKRGGYLYDPGKNSVQYGLRVNDKVRGDPMFSFKEVGQKCFDNYLKFLQTKRDSFLIVAQREVF